MMWLDNQIAVVFVIMDFVLDDNFERIIILKQFVAVENFSPSLIRCLLP